MNEAKKEQPRPTTNRVCVLIVYFGQLPGYLGLWKLTAQRNCNYDFYLIQDQLDTGRQDNIYFRKMNLEEINALPFMQTERLKCPSPYKLCDYRPVLPMMFQDIVKPYEFWGWGDLDVVYGCFNATLTPSLDKNDYIATGWQGQSGPLAILRNCAVVTGAWKHIPKIKEMLNSPESFAIDETHFLEVLRQRVTCDIVFREPLHDLPAIWRNGRLFSSRSGNEYALFHFGGRLKATQLQISRASKQICRVLDNGPDQEDRFEILRSYRLMAYSRNPLVRFCKRWVGNCFIPVFRKNKAKVLKSCRRAKN